MLLTKLLLVVTIIVGVLELLLWNLRDDSNKKIDYIIMWGIAVMQILTRICDGG